MSPASEMTAGENKTVKSGIFLDRPCVVKILNAEKGEDEKSAFNVSLFPWCPLAEDSVIPLPVEWVVTIVEPKQKLKEMYLEDVIGKDSEDSVPDEQADTDQ